MTRKKRRRRSRSRKHTAVAWGELTLKPRAALTFLKGPKLLSLLLLLALGWLAFQFFTSDRFYVQEATVNGNRLVSADVIYAQSGLAGKSIFFIRPHEVEATIAQLPQIKAVQVSIGLPNQVHIEVQEYWPVVEWRIGEARYGADEEGQLLPAEAILEGIPLIEDQDGLPLQPGDQIDVSVVHTALGLHELLGASRLAYSRARGIVHTTEQGWPVYFKPGEEDLTQKVRILRALVRELEARGRPVDFIDLRFDRPYYRER
ncbi:MAG: cell division protein FtsQ/DivIB [Anaerolineae bacterium]